MQRSGDKGFLDDNKLYLPPLVDGGRSVGMLCGQISVRQRAVENPLANWMTAYAAATKNRCSAVGCIDNNARRVACILSIGRQMDGL